MTVDGRLVEAFDLWDDLARILGDDQVSRGLPVPSNTIWDQLWCVVGGRESYARAMIAGAWQGFSCSLTSAERGRSGPIVEGLTRSRGAVESAIERSTSTDFAIDLLLHETQHQGQVIRFMYGLGIDFPESWKTRWSL